jgi:HAD superfamily phosphatase (TIGR01668 family)
MLLKPKVVVEAVTDVTLELLAEHGLRAVMVDLDDTLVPSTGEGLSAPFAAWVDTLKEAKVPVLILSNGEARRVSRYAQELGVRGLALVGKPWFFAFRRGLKLLGSEPKQTAMVGDQLFTDVLGANLAGLTSILVSPLSPGKLPHTRAIRRVERLILGRQP